MAKEFLITFHDDRPLWHAQVAAYLAVLFEPTIDEIEVIPKTSDIVTVRSHIHRRDQPYHGVALGKSDDFWLMPTDRPKIWLVRSRTEEISAVKDFVLARFPTILKQDD